MVGTDGRMVSGENRPVGAELCEFQRVNLMDRENQPLLWRQRDLACWMENAYSPASWRWIGRGVGVGLGWDGDLAASGRAGSKFIGKAMESGVISGSWDGELLLVVSDIGKPLILSFGLSLVDLVAKQSGCSTKDALFGGHVNGISQN